MSPLMLRRAVWGLHGLTPLVSLLFASCGSETSNGPSAASNSALPTVTMPVAPTMVTTSPATEGTQPATPSTSVTPPPATVAPTNSPSTTTNVPPTPPSNTGVTPPATTTEPETSSSTTTDSSTSSETTAPHTGSHDHCVMGYEVDPSDDTMANGFAEYTENGQTDAVLQPEIITWMEDHEWQEAHFQWHNVRRCGGFGAGGGGDFNPCDYPELAPDANECENAQDGYEFLVMHRHMLESLRQLFPSHVDQFEGWDKWPAASDYPELLQPYFKNWSNDVLNEASIADNIEDNIDMFATEGEFGMWIQCGSLRGGVGANSLHGALHFNGYPQNNQSHSVANQRRNLDSFIFWKLHGYIDKVWERYRLAKGQAPDEPALRTEIKAQCLEMDALAHYIEAGGKPPEETELPDEYGFFHEVVRPGLENFGCATCHGAGEDAGLRLGFQVSSADIVAGLVNVDSAYATGYKLVVPGDPDNSWLYLKAAGLSGSSGAQCQGVMNCTQSMPPGGGDELPDADLANLRQWIEDGAPPPTNTP